MGNKMLQKELLHDPSWDEKSLDGGTEAYTTSSMLSVELEWEHQALGVFGTWLYGKVGALVDTTDAGSLWPRLRVHL